MNCQNCKKYDDCRTGSGLTWPCGAYRPKEETTRYVLCIRKKCTKSDFAFMGRTVFLTRAEAEAALEGMKNG
jgi:hypothetical protein|nr:MAG TPA: hypothetical protein [Caudoviricetes sp.]